jgi:hypothetical protein
MGIRILYLAAIAVSLMSFSGATYLNVIGPATATLNNSQSIYLGKIGPGESFYVLASATTTNSTGFAVNIGWDELEAASLPQGWSSQPSPLYENPMKLKVTVPQDASYGMYNLTIRAVNVQNYSRLGNITVTAYVNVTPNVYNITASPTHIQSGVGQPTNIYIRLNNTGISDDPFIINAYGLPAWNLSDQVVVLHDTKSTYIYPIYVNEPGTYHFNLTVVSATSPSIGATFPVTVVAQASLLNDYSAVGQGVILSPIIMEPSYEFMLLLSYIYRHISR